MFIDDVPAIQAHALASAKGLSDVIEFVLCTIRQPLQRMQAQRADIAAKGAASAFLFGPKRAGWIFAQEHADYLYRVTLDILNRDDSDDRKADLIQHFMQVPGLGMVKAAFVVQCIGGGTACIDSHNLTRLGLTEAAVRVSSKLKPATIRAKVLAYVGMCESTGGSAYWWDTWCDYVADRRGSPLKTAEAVSKYHVAAVVSFA